MRFSRFRRASTRKDRKAALMPQKPLLMKSHGLMKPLLLLAAGLLMTGCGISTRGVGCVTYTRYAPTVSINDTAQTIADVTTLDAAMEAACK